MLKDVFFHEVECIHSLTKTDFYIHTYNQSPKAFVRGVVKGTSSLVSNTTAGFLSVAGRISKSMGHGVLTLSSKDQRYLKSRERLAKEKKDIYIRPAKDFFHGIFHGVTGIVADPYHGAKEGKSTSIRVRRKSP